MKKLILICSFLYLFTDAFSQNWTWVKGNALRNSSGKYGLINVDSISSNPGARSVAHTWQIGNTLYLFGGNAYSKNGTQGAINDFWKYNINSNTWTWIGGRDTNYVGTYYSSKFSYNNFNNPGSRMSGATWTDKNNNLYLFGGMLHDFATNNYNSGYKNDLWKYNTTTNQWGWIGGSSDVYTPGVYGTKNVSSSLNYPGSRLDMCTAKDTSGNIWMFGGDGLNEFGSSAGNVESLNDLWYYNTQNNRWTWVSGDSITASPTVYGTLGVESPSNHVGRRSRCNCWVDKNNNFWLFGGLGIDSTNVQGGDLNELWMFNTVTKNWKWMGGSKIYGSKGNYGTKGIETATNFPGARYYSKSFVDNDGNLWLFGGRGNADQSKTFPDYLNDVWRYNIATNKWAWMKGNNATWQKGFFGQQGVSNTNNNASSRNLYASWSNGSNFWIFGGEGNDSTGTQGYLSDLWKLDVSTLLPIFYDDFRISKLNCNVMLTWAKSIDNCIKLTIEKADESGSFKTISIINKSDLLSQNSYTDFLLKHEQLYRLKYFFEDGSIRYSKTILYKNDCLEKEIASVQTIANTNEIKIYLKNFARENIHVKLYNVDGRILLSNNLLIEENQNIYSIKLDKILSKGIYFIMLIDSKNQTATKQFVLQ